MNAVQTGFVDAATAASVKATKAIAAAETLERKAVAKADVVLAQDLQSAWGTYAAAERSAVTLNARERATIGADFKKEVAGAELAAIKAVAPARKTSMVATAEANGVYHVKVTGIVADLGILGGEIKVEATKAKATSISAWLGQKAQGLWDTAKDVVGTISKSYDAISMVAHTTLSGFGVIPVFGVVPDLADLALTAAELPFGKSDGKDLGLAAVGVFATVAPGPVDGLAAGAKIGTRMAKAGAKVADGAGAAGKGLGELAEAGRHFVAPQGPKHWTDFADEAGRIMENAAKSRGLDPAGGVMNMAITRKQAMNRIEGLISEGSQRGIEAHIGKLTRPGAGPHIRAELSMRMAEIERLAEHCGEKTSADILTRISEWRKRISEISDVDY